MTDPIEITTEIAALPATVAGFFTDPARFEQWFGQGSAIDPRPGGAFRVAYPGGAAASGEVVEIGPERVVLTWGFEGDPVLPPGASTVTFSISPIPSGTRLHLRQDGVPAERRDGLTAGFGHALAVLAAAGAAAEVGPLAERLADAIVTAFNTGDDAERRRLLERAWAPAAVFRGPMANATGCDGLDAHIANARRHGGGRVVRVGPVRAGHRHLAWSWRIEDDGGRAWATGTDLAEVGLDGRLAWLTGLWDPPAVTSAENC